MPAPRRPAFGIAFNLPFDEALAYSTKRGVVLPDVYYGELKGKARAQAFSIAGVARAEQLQSVLGSLNEVLAKGGTFADWQRKVKGNEIALNMPRHRLDNIFRTNIQGAYGQGRWEAQKRNLKSRPYLMYDAINDSRTRPAHRAMDGHIARADDQVWRRWYPPCGYRCRCTIISLTEAEARARGIGKSSPDVEPDEGWDYDIREDSYAGIKEAVKRTRAKSPAKIAAAIDPVIAAAEASDPNKWRLVPGSQKGSNEGGIYEAPDGSRHYVKFPADPDQARTEVAAARIYEALGVETVRPDMITLNGRVAVASRFRDDLQQATPGALTKDPEQLARIFQGSVLVKNWDMTGARLDNIMVDAKGRFVIVDTGASFRFRAQGAPKEYGADITEVTSLLNPATNPQASKLFKPLFDADVWLEQRGAKPVMALTREKVDEILGAVNFKKKDAAAIGDALWARRELLIDRYDLDGKRMPAGIAELLDEFKASGDRFRYEGGLDTRGIPSQTFREDFKIAMLRMEAMAESKAYKGATASLRLLFNQNWSGSSSAVGSGAIKAWARDRFGMKIEYHAYNYGADANTAADKGLARVLLKAKATKEQLYKAFDIEYAFHQYMLRRLHGWDEFTIERGMSNAEADSFVAGKRGQRGTFTFNAVASATTSQSVFAKTEARIRAFVRPEDFVKTWYQGDNYMHYGTREAEYVILGRTVSALRVKYRGRRGKL